VSWFNPAAGNYAPDGYPLSPPLPPSRMGKRNTQKGKLVGSGEDSLITQQRKY